MIEKHNGPTNDGDGKILIYICYKRFSFLAEKIWDFKKTPTNFEEALGKAIYETTHQVKNDCETFTTV